MIAAATVGGLLAAGVVAQAPTQAADRPPVVGSNVTYTTDEDFEKGLLVNVNHDAPNSDQLQLNESSGTFPFIWIALSARSTIAKVDTVTGAILGEYRTVIDGQSGNTSRTTVGLDGSVWAGNRDQSSVIHVGLKELDQCVDRNTNGVIDTSTGYGDVKPWTAYGTPNGASTAEDECILHFVDTSDMSGGDARHVSVARDGFIWVGNRNGTPAGATGGATHRFQKIDPDTGTIVAGSQKDFVCGGYGGLIDAEGVLWSASSTTSFDANNGVLRWDPDNPDDNGTCLAVPNYGMAVDPITNEVWVSTLGEGNVRKLDHAGNIIGTFPQGSPYAQGLAVDRSGNVWVSASLICSSDCSVGHLLTNGEFVGSVPTPAATGHTGVAVDAAGKVWTANINSSNATRIDPNAGPESTNPDTPGVKVGAVDPISESQAHVAFPATSGRPAASPYNYSDMTGSVLLGAAKQGSWTVVQDAGEAGFDWATVMINREPQGFIPPGAEITATIEAKAADTQAGLGAEPFVPVDDCGAVGVAGRFIQVRLTLKANDAGDSPVLSDVTIRGGEPPTAEECEGTTTPDKVKGYAALAADGGWFTFGEISWFGAAAVTGPSGNTYNGAFVGGAITPSQRGYWGVGSDGGVFAFGDARFFGSMGGQKLNAPIVGMAATPSGQGYWLAAADGGVFAFGDAVFAGSMGGRKLNDPVVGIAASQGGQGYYLVAEDGGVFAFGDAVFNGSTGGITLNAPVVGLAASPTGGYWLVGEDGGVFAFGGAGFFGSTGGIELNAPVTGIASSVSGLGYVMAASDGGMFAFGDAPFFGSLSGVDLNAPIVAIVSI